MADLDKLNKPIEKIVNQFSRVSRAYVIKIAEQILKIGELSASSIHDLIVMRNMNMDIAEINKQLADVTQQSISEILQIYQEVLNDVYTDPRFKDVLEQKPLTQSEQNRLRNLVRRISIQTAEAMQNYANTTAVSQEYHRMVDDKILQVASGLTDYATAAREAIREMGGNGLKVEYESGYHRRLDSAVRMNIIDGVRQINTQASLEMGQIYGDDYDAIELSAHAMSALDHEPIQGRVFLLEEWEKMQSEEPFEDTMGNHYEAIRRAIGIWNCKHYPMAFSTKYNKPRYTEEQLQKFIDDNHKGCYINGKHYTMYEASQLMRQMETKIRREKDIAICAKEIGDIQLQKECQERINNLSKEYQSIAEQAGLKPRMEKTSVEGFRAIKSNTENAPIPFEKEDTSNNPIDYTSANTFANKDIELTNKLRSGNVQEKAEAVNEILNNPEYGLPESKWSKKAYIVNTNEMGRIIGRKEWNCDITIREDHENDIKTYIHENLHSRSISHYPVEDAKVLYAQNLRTEEGAVEYLAQEICNKNNIQYSSSYTLFVNAIKDIKHIVSNRTTDYEFAIKVFENPIDKRYNMLEDLVNQFLDEHSNVRNAVKERLVNDLNILSIGR